MDEKNNYIFNDNNLNVNQKRWARENNVYMWNVLNTMVYNTDNLKEKMPAALHMQLINKHLKNADSKTGLKQDLTAKKLLFLYKQLLNNEDARKQFKSSCLYSTLKTLFCSNYSDENPWDYYKQTANCSPEYKDKLALTAALRAYRLDDDEPVGLDTCKLIDSFVHGDSEANFYLKDTVKEKSEKEQENILSSIGSTLKILKNAKDFKKYYVCQIKENDDAENE